MGGHIDTDSLLARLDLVALIEADTRLRRVASTGGGEWSGPCPFCGGEDRFRVQPEQGRWWCRRCSPDERWQDAIGYVMRRDNVTFPEACRLLGDEPVTVTVTQREPMLPPVPIVATEPTPAWRRRAQAVVARCEEALWSPEGARARAWLRKRGLSDETLRARHVGFKADDRPMLGLRVPRGITLPWFVDGVLWQVKVRRATGTPKYLAVAGGHPYLYGADTLPGKAVAVLTEGEFDAMLLHQEAGDLVGVVSLGSCSKAADTRVMHRLFGVARLLVAYDADDAGEAGTAKQLASSARMRPMPVPTGGDITGLWEAGGNLRDWVRYYLAREDGGMTGTVLPPTPDAVRARRVADPRDDLARDSAPWTRLLALAYARDGGAERGLFGALHALRCDGAELAWRADGRLRLRAGDIGADSWAARVEHDLKPHEHALRDLFTALEEETRQATDDTAPLPLRQAS